MDGFTVRRVRVVLGSLATVGTGLARSYDQIQSARVLVGVGGAAFMVIALTILMDLFPRRIRGRVLAGFFLGAYIGLSAPVIALGIATEYAAARDVMLVFVVLAAAAIAAGVRAVLRNDNERHG